MRRPTLPPLREDYFELDRHVHFVDVEGDRREAFAEMLESYGFKVWFLPREVVIGTFLPFDVDMKKKRYTCMGNVTCAAAAATRRVVLDEDEFQIIVERDLKK